MHRLCCVLQSLFLNFTILILVMKQRTLRQANLITIIIAKSIMEKRQSTLLPESFESFESSEIKLNLKHIP